MLKRLKPILNWIHILFKIVMLTAFTNFMILAVLMVIERIMTASADAPSWKLTVLIVCMILSVVYVGGRLYYEWIIKPYDEEKD